MTKAVVVGSGPNGLAAAVTLALHGVEVTVLEAGQTVGGGTRSAELTVDGVLHDECSGFHPLAVDTAFSRMIDLSTYGLQWLWPQIQYAHPLDGESGAAAYRSVPDTAAGLGPRGGTAWRRIFGSLAQHFADVTKDFLQPMVHIPRHPVKLAHFGSFAGLPANALAGLLGDPAARALYAGVAAHAFRPLDSLGSSAIGVALGTAAHRYGWPVAQGGSQSIAQALHAALLDLGGNVETGVRVSKISELPFRPDILMLNTTPSAAVDILHDAISPKVASGFLDFQHGPAAFVVNFAVEGGIPWSYEPARQAGTVHVGGSFEEIARVEKMVVRGLMPENPFVLVGQQSVADSARSHKNIHPVDAYAHVPARYRGDATEAIEKQIERFAPGFRDRIVGRHLRSTQELEHHNPNYLGGDIVTGSNDLRQLFFRPRITLHPYNTGVPGVYLCSAATPPGAGAHGMAGYNAAMQALKEQGIPGRISPQDSPKQPGRRVATEVR